MTQAVFDPLVDTVKGFLHYQPHLAPIISEPENIEWRDRPHFSLPCLPEILALDDPPTPFLRNLQDKIKAVLPLAEWKQSYTKKEVGKNFLNHYGYFELIGPNGHYHCDNFAAFIGYCGPGLFYNWHVHRADEVYLIINGAPTFHSDPNRIQTPTPGLIRLHSSLEPHAITIGAVPLLTLALWGGEEIDRLPKILTRRRPWHQRINYAISGSYERKERPLKVEKG